MRDDKEADEHEHVTALIESARKGSASAQKKLLDLIYGRLHEAAKRAFRNERAGHTLQPTALVHDAYIQLMRQDREWSSRQEFLAVAASAMRRLLSHHARDRQRLKRGGGRKLVTLDVNVAGPSPRHVDLLELDQALTRLSAEHPRCAQVVELRFFAGLSNPEVAQVLGVSLRTVEYDWRFARALLRRDLQIPDRDT